MATWQNITEFNSIYGTGDKVKNKIFIKVSKAEDCEFLVQNLSGIDTASLIFLANDNYRQIIAKNQLYSLKMSDFTALQAEVNALEGRVDNLDAYIGYVSELETTQKIVVKAINELYDLVGTESVAYQISEAIEDVQSQIDTNKSDIQDLQARTITLKTATGEQILNIEYSADVDGENNPTGDITYTLSTVTSALDSEINDKIDNALSLDSNQESIKVLKQLAYEIGYFKTEGVAYWENEDGVAYSVIDVIMSKLNGQMTQEEIEAELAEKIENININNVAGTITDKIAYVTLDTDNILVDEEIARPIVPQDGSISYSNMTVSDAIRILNSNINEAIQNAGVTGLTQGEGVILQSPVKTGDAYQGNVLVKATGETVKLAYNISYISDADVSTMTVTDAIAILAQKINTNSDRLDGHDTRLDTAEQDILDIKDDITKLQSNMSYLEWTEIN